MPSDLWNTGPWGFIVFDLRASADSLPDVGRLALFTLDLRDMTVISVQVITADAEQSEAMVEDLRGDDVRSLPMPADW